MYKRQAYIEITEKNFDVSFIKWKIKGKAKIGKWKSKANVHYCEVVFSEDGIYNFAFSCEAVSYTHLDVYKRQI